MYKLAVSTLNAFLFCVVFGAASAPLALAQEKFSIRSEILQETREIIVHLPENYDPENIDIEVGTTIVWENVDNTMHTASSGNPDDGLDEVFDSDIMSAGDLYEFTFTEAGSYDYYCILHPWMVGTVNVE